MSKGRKNSGTVPRALRTSCKSALLRSAMTIGSANGSSIGQAPIFIALPPEGSVPRPPLPKNQIPLCTPAMHLEHGGGMLQIYSAGPEVLIALWTRGSEEAGPGG